MYRTIDAAFWTDPKVRDFRPNERLFFLYLITNPHTHISGIYYLPWLIAEHETGLPAKVLNAAADTLSRVGVTLFDRPKELVWVVNMFSFQGSGQKNTLSAAYHLAEDIHNSFLTEHFIKRYPAVAEPYKNRVSEFSTPNPIYLIPNTESKDRGESAAVAAAQPALTFGEFQRCRLTQEQYDKLNVKLNGQLRNYIDRYDRWLDEQSPQVQKKRKAYNTILNWYERDVRDFKSSAKRPKETAPPLAGPDLAMQQFYEMEAEERKRKP